MDFSLCILPPEVQCLTFHQSHVVWQTKITNFWRNRNDSQQAWGLLKLSFMCKEGDIVHTSHSFVFCSKSDLCMHNYCHTLWRFVPCCCTETMPGFYGGCDATHYKTVMLLYIVKLCVINTTWNRNCPPFRSTWVHHQFLVGLVLLDL